MKVFEELKAEGFSAPTAEPVTEVQRLAWQAANRTWWEAHPMRYDWRTPLGSEPGERAWFEEMDRRFFAAGVIPSCRQPFDTLIPYEDLPELNVLEIGVGMGSHAQLLAARARRFVGIDLTTMATSATRRRFSVFGLPGEVLQMNVENLGFADHSFDLVWSWGVIHHSADTSAALREIRRVLKPSGRALVMVYHRALMPWYVYGGLLRGVLGGGLLHHSSVHRVVQSRTDGALARFYTASEWKREVEGIFRVERLETFGNRAEALPIPGGRIKRALLSLCPEKLLHFWLSGCRQGTLLFSSLLPR